MTMRKMSALFRTDAISELTEAVKNSQSNTQQTVQSSPVR